MNKVTDWMTLAETDLQGAKNLLEDGIANLSCFLSQQAIEKCLKAIIASSGNELPKTHDLPFLYKQAFIVEPQLSSFKEEVNFLNQFYIPTRYPDIAAGSLEESLPSREEAVRAVKYAQEIFNFVKEKI